MRSDRIPAETSVPQQDFRCRERVLSSTTTPIWSRRLLATQYQVLVANGNEALIWFGAILRTVKPRCLNRFQLGHTSAAAGECFRLDAHVLHHAHE